MTALKDIRYWGAGFLVTLRHFPMRSDSRRVPDVRFGKLHRLISWRVLTKPGRLTGSQLYFLRAHLDINRSVMARMLGITRRTLINWEDRDHSPITAPPLVELAIRQVFTSLLFPGEPLNSHELLTRKIKGRPGRLLIDYSEYQWFGAEPADATHESQGRNQPIARAFYRDQPPRSMVIN
jgi:DNA-binding XRE family transcriptional regulator